uniref:Uncharacterized protein n=1 Tax=Romanomermis culicivorax TaxID=13658 RepID=A0A915L438_ROMCU
CLLDSNRKVKNLFTRRQLPDYKWWLLAGDRYLFQARCSNVKDLHAILKAIAFNEDALINVSSSGVRVIVEDVKCLQANAFLQTELFDEFVLKEE